MEFLCADAICSSEYNDLYDKIFRIEIDEREEIEYCWEDYESVISWMMRVCFSGL